MASEKRPAKVQRWIDLIAALLRRASAVPFDTLANDVPAYANKKQSHSARMRMFERDKDELRELGVPIEAVAGEDGQPASAYQLKTRTFYLPYVQYEVDYRARRQPRRPRGIGYQSLPVLAFTPDELALVSRGVTRVQQMGHASLATDAATALRKLAFDVAFADEGVRDVMLHPFRENNAAVLDVLDAAVRRRKEVTFSYRSMERDVRAVRRVQPYGLLFISTVWYLLANDLDAQALRHFRVSRIADPKINAKNAQRADYQIPDDFDLWSHAESRQSWELGDGDALRVTVKFDASSGYAAAGAELGAESARAGCREFVVRRPDAFVRWLLSFGGAARPVAPKTLVQEWRALAEATAAQYAEGR